MDYNIRSVDCIKDKNGKNCFEGDKVRINYNGTIIYKGKFIETIIQGKIDWFDSKFFIFTTDEGKVLQINVNSIDELEKLEN